MCSPLLKSIAIAGMKPLAGLSDTGIAMLAAMALFLTPVDRANGVRAMDWAHGCETSLGCADVVRRRPHARSFD